MVGPRNLLVLQGVVAKSRFLAEFTLSNAEGLGMTPHRELYLSDVERIQLSRSALASAISGGVDLG